MIAVRKERHREVSIEARDENPIDFMLNPRVGVANPKVHLCYPSKRPEILVGNNEQGSSFNHPLQPSSYGPGRYAQLFCNFIISPAWVPLQGFDNLPIGLEEFHVAVGEPYIDALNCSRIRCAS